MRWTQLGLAMMTLMAVTGCRGDIWAYSDAPAAGHGIAPRHLAQPPATWRRVGRDDTPGIRLERTSDGGRTWHGAPSPCGRRFVNAFLSSPARDQAWLVCTAEPGAGSVAVAVYATDDAGASWSRLPSGPLGGFGYPSGLSMTTDGVGILTEERGVSYRTDDGGRHWHPLLSITAPDVREGLSATQVSDSTARILVFSGDTGTTLYRSTDGDRHWTAVRRWPPR
jgi:photosystem II stability/assembly factor-like uncharacterized protein